MRTPTARQGRGLAARGRGALIGAALGALAGGPAAAQVNLPDFGDPTGGAVSSVDEKRLGEAFMRQVRAQLPIVEDADVEAYVQRLGGRIANEASHYAGGFYFFVVADDSINAFAAPGGFVGINSGLILTTESESELASVVAHEVAHVTQRHIARMIDMQSKSGIYTIAGMLAAVMIGMAGGGQAGSAAGAGVMAAQQQRMIDFTRANEKEADRVGMQMLEGAGYDPRAMPVFFERLQNASRYYRRPPEFLSTHPVTSSRIADSRGRAEQFPKREIEDSFAYHLVRAKLTVLLERQPEDAVRKFEAKLESREYASLQATVYGWGLALSRAGQHEQAAEVLSQLLETYPNVVAFRAALAENSLRANRVNEALALYREGYELFPDNRVLVRGYARALLRARQARTALEVVDDYARLYGMDGPLHRIAAEGHEQLGQQAQSQLSLGEFYYSNGQLTQAVQQLRLAAAAPDRDFYTGARIDARLSELEAELSETRQRR